MEPDQYLSILKSISDESRYKILSVLLKQDLCVGGLAKQLDISKAAVSQHLQILRKARVVTGEKRGYYTHYIVNRELSKHVGMETIEFAESTSCVECCHHNSADKYDCDGINSVQEKD